MDIYYVNGQFVKDSEALISINDLSVIRGYGVFDFLRTYNGVPFHLKAHLERLQNSAKLIGLGLPFSLDEIGELITKGLHLSEHKEKNVRIVVTGGLSENGITPGDSPNLLLMITETKPNPVSWREEGAKVITSHVDRFMPGAKTINYIPAIICQKEATDQGAIEAVYVDKDGYLLEGTTSNLFVLRDDTIITPPCHRVLPGITRQVVMQLCNKFINIIERPIHKDEIPLVDEIFITSSIKEMVPVTKIDSVTVGKGEIGPISQKVLESFREVTHNYS